MIKLWNKARIKESNESKAKGKGAGVLGSASGSRAGVPSYLVHARHSHSRCVSLYIL